jgi:hypothetical protein
MKKIQSDSISGGEVAIERDVLSNKMKSRRDENFCTTKLISLLRDVEDVYINEQFTEVANSFYDTFPLYLEKMHCIVFRKMEYKRSSIGYVSLDIA